MRAMSKGMLVVGVLAVAASSALAVPLVGPNLFAGEVNRLSGVIFGTDENTGQPGEMVSLGLNGGTISSVNLFQATVNDPQNPLPLNANGFNAGARSGAVGLFNLLTDGGSVDLLPTGQVTFQAFNLTPKGPPTYTGSALNPLIPGVNLLDNGAAPGGLLGDGIFDQVLIPAPSASAFTFFITQEFFDRQDTALFGGNPVPNSQIGKVKVYDDPGAGGTLLDASLSAARNLTDADGDGRILLESDFDIRNGGAGASEVGDAVDGTVILEGEFIGDITSTFAITINAARTIATMTLVSISGSIEFTGGSLLHLLEMDANGKRMGAFDSSWSGIPIVNGAVLGVDPNTGQFDFIGNNNSAAMSFKVIIPEPLSVFAVLSALGGLGAYARKRYAA